MMAVPKFYEFFNTFLESLQDGKVHHIKECRQYILHNMNLSDADLAETIPSGESRVWNRIHWSSTYLKKSGLIISPQRAHYQITSEGEKVLSEKITITVKFLADRYSQFTDFHASTNEKAPSEEQIVEVDSEETPQDTFERVYKEINEELADELLTAVHDMSPQFFERLVVKLLERMGYGGYEGAGFVTKYSNDGGIDGIIDEDKLGFNRIYIQAKRWALDTVVGRPEIQKFMGALVEQPKIGKGLFITTAKFSDAAREYANNQHIILVDGKKLAELMIEFDVGVSTQKTYKIKRIDSDFFNEDE